MLDIKKIPVNMLEENCYFVSDDTRGHRLWRPYRRRPQADYGLY